MEDVYKEVYFDQYCKTCEHEKDDETNPLSPCWDCLDHPVNVFTHKPLYWKEKEKQK